MAIRIEEGSGDDPALRRLLMRELGPMLGLPASAEPRPRWIAVVVRSDDTILQGGLIGLVTGAWLSLDLLWLPEALRRQGVGSRVVTAAERLAISIGCLGAHVGTTSAAACAFYAHNGYVPRLIMPEIAPGVTQTVLQKTFVESSLAGRD